MSNPGPNSQSTTNTFGLTTSNLSSSAALTAHADAHTAMGLNGRIAGVNAGKLAVAMGDSIVAGGNYTSTTGTLKGNGNTISIAYNNHGIYPGGDVFITGCTEDGFNGYFTNAIVIDANNAQVVSDRSVSGTATVLTDQQGATAAIQVMVPERVNDRSFIEMANATLGHPIDRMINAGGSGQSSTMMLARFDRDVIAWNPDIVILGSCARNDLNTAAYSQTRTLGNIQSMINKALAINATVFLFFITPKANDLKEMALNTALSQLARSTPGVIAVNIIGATLNTTSATGDWIASYSTDGTHPNSLGARRMTDNAFTPSLKLMFPNIVNRLGFISSADDRSVNATSTQALRNPGFLTTTGGSVGGTATGTAPANYSCTNSSGPTTAFSTTARTIAADGDTLGNNLVITMSGAASGVVDVLCDSLDALVSVGEKFIFTCSMRTASIANLRNVAAFVEVTAGGITYTVSAMDYNGSGSCSDDFNWVLQTKAFTIPSGMTSVVVRWKATFAANPSGVINIGAPALRLVTS